MRSIKAPTKIKSPIRDHCREFELSTSSNSGYLPAVPMSTDKNVTSTTMDANSPSNREISPFVASTRQSITSLRKQKKDGPKADQDDPKTIDLALEPVKQIFMKNPDIYIIKLEQYEDLLTKAKGNPDIVQLAQSYINNLSSLIEMLRDTYISLYNRSIENIISRIIKKLELHSNWTEDKDYGNMSFSSQDSDLDSDFSISSEDDASINLSVHS